jgi:hypothetical protein
MVNAEVDEAFAVTIARKVADVPVTFNALAITTVGADVGADGTSNTTCTAPDVPATPLLLALPPLPPKPAVPRHAGMESVRPPQALVFEAS